MEELLQKVKTNNKPYVRKVIETKIDRKFVIEYLNFVAEKKSWPCLSHVLVKFLNISMNKIY